MKRDDLMRAHGERLDISRVTEAKWWYTGAVPMIEIVVHEFPMPAELLDMSTAGEEKKAVDPVDRLRQIGRETHRDITRRAVCEQLTSTTAFNGSIAQMKAFAREITAAVEEAESSYHRNMTYLDNFAKQGR